MKHSQALRQTYLTPTQLNLSPQLYEALAWFVDEVDAGNIVDTPANTTLVEFRQLRGPIDYRPDFFNMRYVNAQLDCGTAGCILGHIRHRIQDYPYRCEVPAVAALFYDFANKPITAIQARDATVRVLRGEPAWPR